MAPPLRRSYQSDPNPIAEWVQRLVGLRGPNRIDEIENMTGPAYEVQKRMGLIPPKTRGAGIPKREGPLGSGGRSLRGVRAPSLDEERRTQGAPGQGGLGMGATPQEPQDPMSAYMQNLAESYDAQIEAIAGLGPIYQQQASEAQENIGGFYGYASEAAQGGIPVTQDIYGTAQENVGNIYDNLAGSLEALPGQVTDIAAEAGGGAVADSVADRVATASAPFMAAGETSRANAMANLTQHSSAGQSYLNNLAASAPQEAAMQQSAVESALNEQLQQVAFQQAELEGVKQRALAEIATDVAGDSSERMANALLAEALGLENLSGYGGAVDPLDYLSGQDRMTDAQQAALNLAKEQNPMLEEQTLLSSLNPEEQAIFSEARRLAETEFEEGDNPRSIAFHMIEALDDLVNQSAGDGSGKAGGKPTEKDLEERGVNQEMIASIIRQLYGG